ncbi:hypothetical protein BV25DRAFT_1805623, partial [Artomyces pyxidatus]
YFPKVFHYMRQHVDPLYARYGIQRNFKSSAYPTATANLGPSTVCFRHHDGMNHPGTPCVITPLGNFDPKRGGHLVLYDLGLKIEFPPGHTIIISSAGFLHGNTPIQQGETRYSFTQYLPGGLVRWVHLGFRRAKEVTKEARARAYELGGGFDGQLARFSKYAELEEDRDWLRRQELVAL